MDHNMVLSYNYNNRNRRRWQTNAPLLRAISMAMAVRRCDTERITWCSMTRASPEATGCCHQAITCSILPRRPQGRQSTQGSLPIISLNIYQIWHRKTLKMLSLRVFWATQACTIPKDGSYEFTQHALVNSIIEDVELHDATVKPVPAKVSQRLHAFKGEPPFDLDFNHRSAVSKLNYLVQTMNPDIMYATHQVAKYSLDPRQSHAEDILYLVCYLKKTRDIGLKFTPDPTKGFECYCDSDFSGLWNKEFAPVDPSTAKSRSGWIIFYAGCPVSWASKLQSQVALPTTKAEYIAMS